MSDNTRHLTGVEFEGLMGRPESGREADLAGCRAHLEQCAQCGRQMERYRMEGERLRALQARVGARPGEKCLAADQLLRLAAGLSDARESQFLLEHAASCDVCGTLLRIAVEDLQSTEIPPEAAAAMSEPFRARVAEELRKQSLGEPKRKIVNAPRRNVYIGGAIAAGIVILLLAFKTIGFFGARPETLIAKAFEADRTWPLRFPGASFTPLRGVNRSARTGGAALAEADAAVLKELDAHPEDRRWLRLSAELDFLHRRYDAAAAILETLVVRPPVSPDLFNDLGAVYLARGLAQNNYADIEKAVEDFSHALKIQPRNPIALFNRAMALESLFLWDRAAQDWKAYLELDANSGWANEARQHLQTVIQKKRSWLQRLDERNLSAAEFVARARSNASPSAELFLNRAMVDWLPDYAKAGAGASGTALAELSRMFITGHGDDWMSNMLRQAGGPAWSRGTELLGEAIRLNNAGDRERGYKRAREAGEVFRIAKSPAGRLRAELEAAYSLSRSYGTGHCIQETGAALASLKGRRYPWLQIQLLLARSMCLGRMGQFDVAFRLNEKAIRLAEDHRYGQLLLRATGLNAGLRTIIGDTETSRRENYLGLRRFWAGVYPPLRGYQFYSDLDHVAERNRQWQVGYMLNRESLPMIQLAGNRTTEAMDTYRLAMFAGLTERRNESDAGIRRAENLMRPIDGESSTKTFRAENLLLLASAYLQNGAPDLAREMLKGISSNDVQNSILLQLGFYKMEGTLAVLGGQRNTGGRELQAALSVAENALDKAHSERDRAIWANEAGPVYRGLVRLALDANDSIRALTLWELYRAAGTVPGQPIKSTDSPALLLQRVASRASGGTFVSFIQFDDHLDGWLIDDRGIVPYRSLLSRAKAESVCSEFRRLASSPNLGVDPLRRVGKELWSELLGPVQGRLQDGRTLAVEPDGPCSGIPFEVLVDPNGSYLIDRMPVITSPGIFTADRISQKQSMVTGDLRAVIVASPRLSGDMAEIYPELPDAIQEGDAVARSFHEHILLAGSMATLSAVQRALPEAGIFHFAGHGVSTSDNGTLLLTAADSSSGAALLQSADVEGTLRQCRLAVLSACRSAAGERLDSFNPDSLVHAFWRASVPNVVATRWDVNSQVTMRLVSAFYRDLLRGREPGSALQSAQQEISRDSNYNHPAYWASFHVFGSPISFH